MTRRKISLSEKETGSGKTLLAALEEKGYVLENGCRGTGRCGKCRVRYLTVAPLPDVRERRMLMPEELRNGVRLACLHRVSGSCEIETEFFAGAGPSVVTEDLTEPDLQRLVSKEDAGHKDGTSGSGTGGWCIVVDLGTTTIAMQARDLASGDVLAEWTSLNPQRRFGADVISRMQAALEGQGETLQRLVRETLQRGVRELTEKTGRTGVAREQDGAPPVLVTAAGLAGIYVAGNTVMEHLLAGLSVEGLSRHPFLPVTLEEQRIFPDQPESPGLLPEQPESAVPLPNQSTDDRMAGGMPWTLLPGISAFVGADILAGVLACGMHRRREVTLLIDLGTNGELVLGNRERLLCTATAAGPAFEGGTAALGQGTDRIAVVGRLLEDGVIDETGLLAEPWFENGYPWKTGGGKEETREKEPAVSVTQEDIRAIQMAKAAVYAGICVLMKEYGVTCDQISAVWLAGGFGYFLDTDRAAQIGLFPKELKEKVKAVGNTSLAGAFLYAGSGGRQAGEVRRICRAVNLAQDPDFEPIYLEHLNF